MDKGKYILRKYRGVNPFTGAEPVGRYLPLDERETIAFRYAQGASTRMVTRALGRSHSTVIRERARGSTA